MESSRSETSSENIEHSNIENRNIGNGKESQIDRPNPVDEDDPNKSSNESPNAHRDIPHLDEHHKDIPVSDSLQTDNPNTDNPNTDSTSASLSSSTDFHLGPTTITSGIRFRTLVQEGADLENRLEEKTGNSIAMSADEYQFFENNNNNINNDGEGVESLHTGDYVGAIEETEQSYHRNQNGINPKDAMISGLPHLPGYRIIEEVGRGGMGVVYKAINLKLNRLEAIKMILHHAHVGSIQLIRFQREAELAARLHHPNIVQVYEIGKDHDLPFLTLEWVDGGTLADLNKRMRLHYRDAAQLVKTLSDAVEFAHQRGILHRDLKPGNILISAEKLVASDQTLDYSKSVRLEKFDSPLAPSIASTTELSSSPKSSLDTPPSQMTIVPKITDFGLAKQISDSSDLTSTGSILGTPEYMSPEQIGGGSKAITKLVDIYSLGVILYELLTGRVPFSGKTVAETIRMVASEQPTSPRHFNGKVPRDLETICLRCLQKESKKRYQTSRELSDDLGAFLSGKPIRARRVGEIERTWMWAKRNPTIFTTLVGFVMTLILAVIVSISFALESKDKAYQATITAVQARSAAKQAQNEKQRADAFAEEAAKNAKKSKEAEELARQSEMNAKQSELLAKEAQKKASRAAAQSSFRLAIQSAQNGNVAGALFLFANAWKQLPPEDAEFRQLIRLNIAAWSPQLPRLHRIIPADEVIHSWHLPNNILAVQRRVFDKPIAAGPQKELDQRLEYWNLETNAVLKEHFNLQKGQLPLGFSPDGQQWLLVTSVQNKKYLNVYSRNNNRLLESFILPDRFSIEQYYNARVTWSRNQNLILLTVDTFTQLYHLALRISDHYEFPVKIETVKDTPFYIVQDNSGKVYGVYPKVGNNRHTWGNLLFIDLQSGEKFDQLADFQKTEMPVTSFLQGRFLLGQKDLVPSWLNDGRGNQVPRSGSFRWFSLSSEKAIGEKFRPDSGLSHYQFSPGGDLARVVGFDTVCRLLDPLQHFQIGGNIPVEDRANLGLNENMLMSPNHRWLTTIHSDGSRRIWAIDQLGLMANKYTVSLDSTFMGEDQLLYSYSLDRKGRFIGREGKYALVSLGDLYGRLIDVETNEPLGRPLNRHLDWLIMSDDSQKIFTATESMSGKIPYTSLYRCPDCKPIYQTLIQPKNIGGYPRFFNHGEIVAFPMVGGIGFFNCATGKTEFQFFDSAAFETGQSPDGKSFALGFSFGWSKNGGGIILGSMNQGKPPKLQSPFYSTNKGQSDTFTVQYTPDGSSLIHGYFAREPINNFCVDVYDSKTGKRQIPTIICQNTRENSNLVVSPDGERVAFRTAINSIQQYDLRSTKIVGKEILHPSLIRLYCYSNDHRLLALTSTDRAVQLWDSDLGQPIGPPLQQRSEVIQLQFSEDNRHLLVLNQQGHVYRYAVPQAIDDNYEKYLQWLQHESGLHEKGNSLVPLSNAEWSHLDKLLQKLPKDPALQPAKNRLETLQELLVRSRECGNDLSEFHYLRQLGELLPQDWHFPAGQALIQHLWDQEPEAKDSLEQAKLLDKQNQLTDWLAHRFYIAFYQRKYDQAKWLADQIIRLDPDHWLGYHLAAIHARQKGDRVQLREFQRQTGKRNPDDRNVAMKLAVDEANDNNWPEAERLLLLSQKMTPENYLERPLLICHIQAGHLEKYHELVKKYLAEVHKNPNQWVFNIEFLSTAYQLFLDEKVDDDLQIFHKSFAKVLGTTQFDFSKLDDREKALYQSVFTNIFAFDSFLLYKEKKYQEAYQMTIKAEKILKDFYKSSLPANMMLLYLVRSGSCYHLNKKQEAIQYFNRCKLLIIDPEDKSFWDVMAYNYFYKSILELIKTKNRIAFDVDK